MPILVAGQHYRTTEASNGSLAEKPAIGRLFMLGGAAAMLYDHMSLYTCFVQINMSFKLFCQPLIKEMLHYLTHRGQESITENTSN